jgi:hypothetical protein
MDYSDDKAIWYEWGDDVISKRAHESLGWANEIIPLVPENSTLKKTWTRYGFLSNNRTAFSDFKNRVLIVSHRNSFGLWICDKIEIYPGY